MKKHLFNLYLLAFFLISDFRLFAQDEPGDDDEFGNLEDEDALPQGAPINTKLILLAIAGISFILYTYRKNKKTA